MSGAAVRLENVSWKYARAQRPALCGASLEIAGGEFLAVMGETGAGKTTLCRLMNGLIPHSLPGRLSGRVTVDGTDTGLSTVARLSEKTGMAFDDPETQFFTARVFDEAAFGPENMLLPPAEVRERTRAALAAAGLLGHSGRAPAALSGGQKQRLAVAAALAMANRVLVLDEPCSRLDPAGAAEVLSFVRRLRSDGKPAVVMATGSPEDAAEFADRVCVLKNGRILALDAPGRIFADRALLREAGIGAPGVCSFAFRMAGLGKPLAGFPLTAEEAAESLAALGEGPDAEEAAAIALSELCPRAVLPPDPGAKAAIRIEGLGFAYPTDPERPVLDGAELEIARGGFVAILGENGSGKTTLLKNITGLLRPSRGRVFVGGKDAAGMGVAEIAGEVGYVMQDSDNQLFEQTVYDEAAFALRLPGQKLDGPEIRRRVEEALETLGIAELRGEFPPALCKADRVKTVFAAVLAMGAKTLVLDEPLAGQDMRGSSAIMETLAALHSGGRTIVLVTHDLRVAAGYAQRIVVMKNGRVQIDADAAKAPELAAELAEAGIPLPQLWRLAKLCKGGS